MAARMVRTRGMEAPYATDQISALVLHPIISVGFVVISAITLEPRTLGIVLAPFLALNVIMMGLWGYISWTDPAGEGGCAIRSKGADTRHYCNFCRKTVRGFDHHCSWLNTCISARNYTHFYLLGVSGSLLYLYMSAVGVLILVLADKGDQSDAFGSLTASRIAWGVFIAVAGWIAVSFVALAGFHTYLLLVGLGTYDWVVLKNQKRQEKLAGARQNNGSRGGRCRWGCGSSRRPPISASVLDSSSAAGGASRGSATPPGAGQGRPESNGSSVLSAASGAKAQHRWGGAGMGIGVTPTRSRVLSNAGAAGGSRSARRSTAAVGTTGGGAGKESGAPIPHMVKAPLDP